MNRSMLCGLALLSLAACGGGDDDRDPSALAQAENRSRTALAVDGRAALVTAEMTLDWAEYSIGDLFPAAASLHFPSVDYLGLTFNARDYSGPWGTRYLGITTDGRVFGLGDFTQGRLEQFETIDYWAPQVLQDWCRVRPADCNAGATGYSNGTPVPPAGTVLDRSDFSNNGAALAVVLEDGSRVDLGAQPAGFGMELEREAGFDAEALAALARRPELQATGSLRGLYVLGSKNVTALKPVFRIPAQDAAGLNPDTLAVLRLGAAVVDGVMDHEHEALLPVARDAQGRLSFVDPLFRDGLYATSDATQAAQRTRARALRARARTSVDDYDWVGGARYILTTFQNDLNWKREPALVRMVADPALVGSGGRRPATAAELATLARQPICNLVLLVHGHNEEEKAGYTQGNAAAPWEFGYKKRVWDLLYQQVLATDLSGKPLYPHACTAFYEFIYPSYRAIYSPVSAKGGGVQETLGEALGRLVGEEVKSNSQLSRMLDNAMPLNTLIVGHSQGGLVARAGLRFMPTKFKAQVKRLVTWGTPHHGAALISMRFAMQAGHDLVIDGYRLPLQNLVQTGVAWMQLDTPGTRDLRLSLRQKDRMNLRAMFPTLDAAAETALAPTLYSANLDEFNTNIGTREIDPGPSYSFLTGTKQGSATVEHEDASGAWWLLFRGQQVAKFAASSGTEKGATLNRLLLKGGSQTSDGAAPLFSQQAAGLYGPEAIDLGDVDHEEFYGSEPAQRNAASLAKGRLAADRSLNKGRLDAADSACPSIDALKLSATGSDQLTVSGRALFPRLASTPGRSGALIQRVEARVGSVEGSVIPGLSFQYDANGQFSASADSSAVPPGNVAVLVVLKDGSQMQGLVQQETSGYTGVVRLFEPATVFENRDGRLRAELSHINYEGAALKCAVTLDWALPTSHTQPLQMRIVRLLTRDGVQVNETFFLKYLSYSGPVLPVGDGTYARRVAQMIDPPTTRTNTALGNQLDLSALPPPRIESETIARRPLMTIEVLGLCGARNTTAMRFDYEWRSAAGGGGAPSSPVPAGGTSKRGRAG